MDQTTNVTTLLQRVAIGDASASDELLPIVYEDLRALAASYFRGQRSDHTLQPTALVHEAYFRLVRDSDGNQKDRNHFMAVAAKAMRQILTDHARTKAAAKRNQGGARLELDQLSTPSGQKEIDIIALEEALTRLGGVDPRMTSIIELWFFGGMTTEEIADIQGISSRTVKRLWRQARAWLNAELSSEK